MDATVDSVLEVFPAANWDEREAHDVYGVRFAGHEPLRALVAHPAELGTGPRRCTGTDRIRSRSVRSMRA